jgi:hypothetical protein
MKKEIMYSLVLISLFFIPTNHSTSNQEVTDIQTILSPNAVTASESWVFNATGPIYSSPAFYDVNFDRNLEIIFGSYDNFIYCVNSSGHEVWKYPTMGSIAASPAVADLGNDNYMDIIVPSLDGAVYCLNFEGALMWKSNMTVSIANDPIVADLDVDGDLEILISDNVNKLYCLDDLGNSLWNYTSGSYSGREPVVGNINATPELEIIMPGPTGVITLDYLGNLLNYDTAFDPNEDNGITLADLNNTGDKQLLLYQDPDTLVCANASDLSEIYFSHADMSKTTSSSTPVVANIDSDANLEIIIVAVKPGMSIFGGQGALYNIESNGTITWTEIFGFYSYFQPLICDVDANQSIDIITACPDVDYRYLEGYDSLGNGVFSFLGTGQITNSPLVIDIDDDAMVEVLYPSSNGKLYCVELSGITNSGKTYWSREKGSSFNTNSADRDGDYIDDLTENYLGTNPHLDDTDADLLLDWEEIYCYRTSPLLNDTDSDGLNDFEEVTEGIDGFVTNPIYYDTDYDTFSDFDEYLAGTDPTDPDDYPSSPSPTETSSLRIIIIPISFGTLYIAVLYVKRRKSLK